jgi:hypothetical protein
MFQFIAKFYAKRRYLWKETVEAELNELGARISKQNAGDKRAMIDQLTADAEAIDKSIAAGMEAESYKALEGQEKYKADQERKEAEKLADGKRQLVKQLEGEIEEHMKTVEYFRKIAKSHHQLADSVRRLK